MIKKLEKFLNNLPNRFVTILVYGILIISDLAAIFGVFFGFMYIAYKLLRMVFCK